MKRWIAVFKFAAEGLLYVFRHERNMRIHGTAAAVAAAVGAWVRLDRGEWLWITACIALVWLTECVNTAVERAVDAAVGSERHPLAKAAKDAAAAAVLVASLFALAAAAMILLPAALEKIR